jgi:hypothetical protein
MGHSSPHVSGKYSLGLGDVGTANQCYEKSIDFPPDYSLRTRYQTGKAWVHARTLGVIQ